MFWDILTVLVIVELPFKGLALFTCAVAYRTILSRSGWKTTEPWTLDLTLPWPLCSFFLVHIHCLIVLIQISGTGFFLIKFEKNWKIILYWFVFLLFRKHCLITLSQCRWALGRVHLGQLFHSHFCLYLFLGTLSSR